MHRFCYFIYKNWCAWMSTELNMWYDFERITIRRLLKELENEFAYLKP